MRGQVSLHACALNVDGGAVAVLGASGAGKSTLGAYMASIGTPVLADDVAALLKVGDEWMVQPGFPAMKFWPDTLELCGVTTELHDRVFNFSDKRIVVLNTDQASSEWRFQSTPAPLRGVFILRSRQPNLVQPVAERLTPIAAIPQLMAHRSSATCDLGAGTDARELKDMAKLAGGVPVWSITCPDDVRQLPATTDLMRRCLNTG